MGRINKKQNPLDFLFLSSNMRVLRVERMSIHVQYYGGLVIPTRMVPKRIFVQFSGFPTYPEVLKGTHLQKSTRRM